MPASTTLFAAWRSPRTTPRCGPTSTSERSAQLKLQPLAGPARAPVGLEAPLPHRLLRGLLEDLAGPRLDHADAAALHAPVRADQELQLHIPLQATTLGAPRVARRHPAEKLGGADIHRATVGHRRRLLLAALGRRGRLGGSRLGGSSLRSEEHTSELQSRPHLVC